MKMFSKLLSTIGALNTKYKLVALAVIFGLLGTTVFQNCAKGKFNLSPEQIQQLAQTYCQGGVTQSCGNSTGSGLQCSVPLPGVPANICVFQSCSPGFTLEGNLCVENVCVPGTVVGCDYTVEDSWIVMGKLKPANKVILSGIEQMVALGLGQKTCNEQGTGYGTCNPVICPDPSSEAFAKLGGRVIASNISSNIASSPSETPPSPSETSPTYSPSYTPTGSPTYTPTPTPSPSPSYAETCKFSCDQGTTICARRGVESSYVFEKTCTEDNQYFSYCNVTGCAEGYVNVVYPEPSPSPTESSPSPSPTSTSPSPSPTESPIFDKVRKAASKPEMISEFNCQRVICQPGAKGECSSGYGYGEATCNTIGTEFGACQLTGCQEGYNLENGLCVAPPRICAVDEYQACTTQNGLAIGSQRCNEFGNGWDGCQTTSCAAGYYAPFNQPDRGCVTKNSVCTADATTGFSWVSCTPMPANAVTAQQGCADFGTRLQNNCTISVCAADYIVNNYGTNNACQPRYTQY